MTEHRLRHRRLRQPPARRPFRPNRSPEARVTTGRLGYRPTLTFFFALLPPALAEVTLKVAFTLPGFLKLSLTLTVFEAPAGIVPAFFFALTPLPWTLSLTPVASALPELVTVTL